MDNWTVCKWSKRTGTGLLSDLGQVPNCPKLSQPSLNCSCRPHPRANPPGATGPAAHRVRRHEDLPQEDLRQGREDEEG